MRNSVSQPSIEHCIKPSRAITEVRKRYNNQADKRDSFESIDHNEWETKIKITDVQEYEWVLTEIEYYTVTEEREHSEFPLSKDIPQNNPIDPFETGKATIYNDFSTEYCSICDGEGISPCETCGGDGIADCPNPDCRDGEEFVRCECSGGQIYDEVLEAYKKHKICDGTGRRSMGSCDVCSNEPPIDKLGKIECRDCSPPDHKNICNNCEGEGMTYHGICIERSYNSEMERTVEGDVPQEVFERHPDCVTVNRYDSDGVPPDEVISEEAQLAKDFRITKKRLKGYNINYSFDGKTIHSTVIGKSVYHTIPKISKTATNLTVIAGIGVFVLWLGVFAYLSVSPMFESDLWFTANFYLGIPIAIVLYYSVYIFLPGMEQYNVDTYNVGFSDY